MLKAGVVTSLAKQQTWQDANNNVVLTELCGCRRSQNEQRAALVLLPSRTVTRAGFVCRRAACCA